MRRHQLILFAGAFLTVVSSAAQALPITYTFSGIASGSYGSTSFTNEALTFDVDANTDTVTHTGYFSNTGVTYITISKVIADAVSQPLRVFSNNKNSAAGLIQIGRYDILDVSDPTFETYDLKTSVSPIAVNLLYYDFGVGAGQANITADGKPLFVSSLELTTFSATVSAVPLPASAPMFGAALFALAGLGFGMKRRPTAAAALS